VHAFGINRADTLQRQGKYPPPKGESEILGLEVSGEIVECGKDVKHWRAGDKVFGLVAGGGYAEYVAVNAGHLMPVPLNIELQEAAGIAEVFVTAYQSLFQIGQLRSGQKVLIHAGASGVGLAAIQLAKACQCEVAVTASSTQKLARCAELGADLLINYTQLDFADRIKSSWKGVDLVIDFVAGDYLNRNLSVLNMDGCIVYLAMLAGRYADPLDMALLLGKRARIIGSTLRNRSDEYKTTLMEQFSQAWLSTFEQGRIKPVIDSCYPAENIALAHNKLEANQSMGKLIGLWDVT
jgi:putative PIG3 family NAD(P)H quinone oxidoreductase